MRLALLTVALLATASTRGGCDRTAQEPYDACTGKSCGDACTVCAPDDAGCAETAVLKACDPSGVCTAAGTFSCPDACAGKKCGDECTYDPPCRLSSPPCMMPSYLGHCDLGGACVASDVSCTPDPCAGKKCGESCNPCGTVPCMTLAATACDREGRCVLSTPWLCYDACAGRKCGDACSICPPDAAGCIAVACLTECDASGLCSCGDAACP